MAKRKISASDLRKIRKNYKEDVKNESDSPVPSRKSQLKDAKLLGKMSKINDTGYTPKELKKQAREKLKDIKENFSSTQSNKAVFYFDVGDAVSFTFNKEEEVGVIVKMELPADCATRAQAKNSGSVTLLSSVGRVEIRPFEVIEKL